MGVVVQAGELTELREPWFGPLTTVKVKIVLSISLALNVMMTGVSSLVEAVIPATVGASLTLLTVINTVAILLVAWPSLTVNLKLSRPLKLAAGVYDTSAAQIAVKHDIVP